MKRSLFTWPLVVAVLMLSLCPAAETFAQEARAPAAVSELEQKPTEEVQPRRKFGFFGKFFHGFGNMLIAPLEIPATVARQTEENPNPVFGVVTGVFEGLAYLFMREVAGITEVVCSPIPPARYPLYDHPLGGPVLKDEPPF